MQLVLQDFVSWFGKFVMISTVVLVASHLVAEKWRARRAARRKAGTNGPELAVEQSST